MNDHLSDIARPATTPGAQPHSQAHRLLSSSALSSGLRRPPIPHTPQASLPPTSLTAPAAASAPHAQQRPPFHEPNSEVVHSRPVVSALGATAACSLTTTTPATAPNPIAPLGGGPFSAHQSPASAASALQCIICGPLPAAQCPHPHNTATQHTASTRGEPNAQTPLTRARSSPLYADLLSGGPAHEFGTDSTPDTRDDENAPFVARGSALDPWSENYAPVVGTAGVYTPTEYDRLYAFLQSLPTDGLRRIIGQLSPVDKKQCGKLVINERKRLKVNKLLLHAALQAATGASYSTIFGAPQQAWEADSHSTSAPLYIAPTVAILRQTAPEGCLPVTAVTGPSSPPFCTNEFARLLALLIDQGAEIRRALLQTRQDLTRDELDRGVERDAVWETLIAPRFNDSSVTVALELCGRVEGVDASASPLANRSGDKLLSVYNKSKAVFTKAYRNWTVSSSKNTEKIGDFVSTQRTTGEPSEEGRRALLMFYALRCGTPEDDNDLLDFTLKTCAQGVAYDDDDAGAHTDPSRKRGGSARRRQRVEDAEAAALVEGNTILREGMSAVVQSLTARTQGYDESTAKRAKDVASLTNDLVGLYDLLEKAQSTGKPPALVRRIEQSIEMTTRSLSQIEGAVDVGDI